MPRPSILDSPEAQRVLKTVLRNKPDASCREIARALGASGIAISYATVNRYMSKRKDEIDKVARQQLPAKEAQAIESAGEALGGSLKENFSWIDKRIEAIDLLFDHAEDRTVAALTNTQRQLIELKMKLLNLKPAPELLDFVEKVSRAIERAIEALPDELRDQMRTKFEAELYKAGFFDIQSASAGAEAEAPGDGERGSGTGV